MKKQTTGVQKPSYHKVRVSAGIFLTTIVVGGLAIFAATNLDGLKAGTNGNTLTATNWDSLIEHVKNHDLIIGEGLSKVDADVLRVESKVDALSGFNQQSDEITVRLSGLVSQISGINNQTTNIIEIFEGNESGGALLTKIEMIKFVVENNNLSVNKTYEKLDEKLEQLAYIISQIQCEGNTSTTDIPEQIYTTVSASEYATNITVYSCGGINCKTYNHVLRGSSYITRESKETGLVASEYATSIDIATCKGTECKIYNDALRGDSDFKVMSSDGTIVVASEYATSVDIATCKGTECKIYNDALRGSDYTVTANNGIITVTATYAGTIKTAKCQGTGCQIY